MTTAACCADTTTDHPATALRWHRSFPGGADQAARVRGFIAALMPDCPVIDDLLLAADEFVVNALRHTKSGRSEGGFTVEVRRRPGQVLIAVTDQGGPTEPVATDVDDLAESGRGLRTVAALADSWGWHGNEHGRTVTAVFATDPRPA
jgi:anti-sigma regulatory factor (Ser/Thr protein kinase)